MASTATTTERDRWFLGTLLQLRATSADTGGHLAVMEQTAARGFSPPRHVHRREDTALYVLEGAITAVVGDERVELGPGGFVWLPRDVPHTFRVDSDVVRQLEFITPAGFEQFHVDLSDQATALTVPPPAEPDVPRLMAVAGGYAAEMVGPPLTADD